MKKLLYLFAGLAALVLLGACAPVFAAQATPTALPTFTVVVPPTAAPSETPTAQPFVGPPPTTISPSPLTPNAPV